MVSVVGLVTPASGAEVEVVELVADSVGLGVRVLTEALLSVLVVVGVELGVMMGLEAEVVVARGVGVEIEVVGLAVSVVAVLGEGKSPVWVAISMASAER